MAKKTTPPTKIDATPLITALAALDGAYLAFNAATRAASEATTAALGDEPADTDDDGPWSAWNDRYEVERGRLNVSGAYAAITRAEDDVIAAFRAVVSAAGGHATLADLDRASAGVAFALRGAVIHSARKLVAGAK